ncbi:hypothetical protein K488DRAFT_79302 [Vararia minispora EC-137]|uniref:Uncharacterized protein n=1 Tax=Vararia minispora EC-137 TaxID=1314806 RepID=A0ACB8QH12_9AGAM|nr:hypothetical protein K488DRAFT_79302 [Vararia minispora EC-137]
MATSYKSPDAAIAALCKQCPSSGPPDKVSLKQVVADALERTPAPSSADLRKSKWELSLKSDVFSLAMREGEALKNPKTTYYDELKYRLDLILAFTEADACDQTFPFSVLQDLLETQTIPSCSHIFGWIEARAAALTADMVPQKGKALIILRTLNDLLRRLSKMGANTIFCGRILAFLSAVFPLGERSGVNLRGEYGPVWEGVEKKLPFSRPPVFAGQHSFKEFRTAVDRVLPVLKEATAKERALSGSRATHHAPAPVPSLKRKRAPDGEDGGLNDYFFAKFLTSPELLELEIADTHFRRQILFQLLILLHHLQNFTPTAKAQWATARNRSLQMDFTLDADDAGWVTESLQRAKDELRQTAPGGRAFADAVGALLERERNWVRWKNDLCAPFDRAPRMPAVEEETREQRRRMRAPVEPWPHSHGSAQLSEIWTFGYNDLRDLENPFDPGDVKDYVKKIKQADGLIANRRNQLERAAAQRTKAMEAAKAETEQEKAGGEDGAKTTHTPGPAKVLPPDPIIARHEESKQKQAWLALRVARERHYAQLAKCETGDVLMLQAAIEDDERVRRREAEAREAEAEAGQTPEVEMREGDSDGRWTQPPEGSQAVEIPQMQVTEGSQMQTAEGSQQQVPEGEREGLRPEEGEKGVKVEEDVPMAQRVLVTGGAGYIGSHVVHVLQQTRRFKVISIDNFHNSHPEVYARLEQIARDALPADATEQDRDSTVVERHNIDLIEPEKVNAVFDKYGDGGIWGVIHIAAYKAVGESTEIPVTYYHHNVAATIFLLEAMAAHGCTRFVYSSSATVYGTPPQIPIPETTRLKADSPYGRSKVMSETIVEDLCSGALRVLRARLPAGAHPSGLIGEDPCGRPGNLLPLLAQMAGGRIPADLQVFGNDYPTPDGTCVRDYLHVMDLAAGHLLALDALADSHPIWKDRADGEPFYRAYNLGRGRGFSVLQIVEAMRKATGFDYKYTIIGRRRGDVPDLTADPTLAERELGFKAGQDLETMCRDLWNWQTKNPNGYVSV